MKKTMVLVVIMGWFLFSGAANLFSQNKGSLYGWVIVLDPGHGGMDPGSSATHAERRVVEDEYVYDVALRVRRMAKAKDAIVGMTLTDDVGERNWTASRIFPDARTERFTLDNSIVFAQTQGLRRRLTYGNRFFRTYPKHRRVWISIHFDVLGKNDQIDGVRIIAPDTELRLAKALEQSFGIAKRLRDEDAIVSNGDRDHGIRRLFILGSQNAFREKVLIELGNFNNDGDLWRIRDWKVREAYAQAIIRALESY